MMHCGEGLYGPWPGRRKCMHDGVTEHTDHSAEFQGISFTWSGDIGQTKIVRSFDPFATDIPSEEQLVEDYHSRTKYPWST